MHICICYFDFDDVVCDSGGMCCSVLFIHVCWGIDILYVLFMCCCCHMSCTHVTHVCCDYIVNCIVCYSCVVSVTCDVVVMCAVDMMYHECVYVFSVGMCDAQCVPSGVYLVCPHTFGVQH